VRPPQGREPLSISKSPGGRDIKLKGYGFILLAAALWGMIGPFSRLAFREGVAPLETAFWRALLAWACFGLHALLKGEVRLQRRDIAPLLAFAVSGVTLFYGSYQIAIREGGAALAAVLLYTAPVWVAVLARVFFKEAMGPVKLLALLLTLGGVAVVSLGAGEISLGTRGGNPLVAVGAGLLAGFCYALYFIFGKYFSGRYSSPNLFVYMLPVGALGLLPWVSFGAKTPLAWMALGILAVVSTYGAYLCYYKGLFYLEPTRAAIVASLEPVIAGVVAFLWWGEYFSLGGYVGSLLVLGAVVCIIWDGGRG
jgi:drug/metabolite transporter (DMT)-like permease